MPKLYYDSTEPHGSWVVPGQQAKRASRVDIPNTPAELAAWLNVRRVPINVPLRQPELDDTDIRGPVMLRGEAAPLPLLQPTPAPQPAARPGPDYEQSYTATGIVDFLLERATQAEVENIFSAIGCRWGEARRAA